MALNFHDMQPAPWPRTELRTALVAVIPADKVDEVIDLACHAADSARHQLFAVSDRAVEGSVKMAALTLATSLIITEAERLQQVYRAVGEQCGMTTFEGTVDMRHG